MRSFQLPEKVKRFLIPGFLLLSFLLLVGGFYFHNRSLLFLPQGATPKEEEGAVSGIRSGLPEKFPDDVPLFEPSEILSSLESQERIQVTLQTAAPAERILEFYQQKMAAGGWRLTGRGVANDNGVLTFLKNERQAQIIITSKPEGPTIIILNTNL